MKTVVVYASKYEFTKGIADFIAEKLQQNGILTEVREVKAVLDLECFDAIVIGSALYMGHWMKESTEFVRRNSTTLADHQVWLFSSGPLGTETKDAQGRDLIVGAQPKEIIEFMEAIHPRDHHVFFGGLDSSKLSLAHRMIRKLPAEHAILSEGDFRDWKDIEVWAMSIARALKALQTPPRNAPIMMMGAK